MTENEIRDQAYRIATGNSLCATLDYEQTQEISDDDLLSIAWEPFEMFSANDLHSHIAQIADDIIRTFGGSNA